MNKIDFIKSKLEMINQDKPESIINIVPDLNNFVDRQIERGSMFVPSDGQKYEIDFKLIDRQNDRLIIEAKPAQFGFNRYGNFEIAFEGTRAHYIYGGCETGKNPHFWWDIRTCDDHKLFPGKRIYIRDFYAQKYIGVMMVALEKKYPSCSTIKNLYMNMNYGKFQSAKLQGANDEKAILAIDPILSNFGYKCATLDREQKGKSINATITKNRLRAV